MCFFFFLAFLIYKTLEPSSIVVLLTMHNETVLERKAREWLDVKVVPALAANFNSKFEDIEYAVSTPSDTFYLSYVYFVDVKVGNATHHLVAKLANESEYWRKVMKSDKQFHNEILFYREFADPTDRDLPRCVHIHEEPPFNSIIVMENITIDGYHLCPQKYDLPMDYALAAMRGIGKFHAKGYAMKKTNPRKFHKIVDDIQDTRYALPGEERFIAYVNGNATRSVNYLRRTGFADKEFLDKAEALLSDAYERVMIDGSRPREPLATLAHGDFTRNNVFFNKSPDVGSLEAKLIDFAIVLHATPVVDLSTFIYLNCDEEQRGDSLMTLLKCYHDTVIGCLRDNGITKLDDEYSYEAFVEDYKRHAAFGFVISSFFLWNLMAEENGGATTHDFDYTKMTIEESVKISMEAGGDRVSAALAKMLLQLRDTGCLDYYFNKYS